MGAAGEHDGDRGDTWSRSAEIQVGVDWRERGALTLVDVCDVRDDQKSRRRPHSTVDYGSHFSGAATITVHRTVRRVGRSGSLVGERGQLPYARNHQSIDNTFPIV